MKTVSVLILLLLSNVLVGYSQDWKYDLNDAFKEANASGKDVLLFFSTSQDCLSCKTPRTKSVAFARVLKLRREQIHTGKGRFQP
jgi:thioredoxin-related protein